VLANFFEFEGHKVAKFQEPVITMYNKSAVLYRDGIAKKNCMVIGDVAADTTMADKSKHENILYVGIFNDPDNKDLWPTFLDSFDIVLPGNNVTFEAPIRIMEAVGSGKGDWDWLEEAKQS